MTKKLESVPQIELAKNEKIVQHNPWQALNQFTDARLALGRAGVSLPTAPQLQFQLAHAQARDAVHFALPQAQLMQELSDQIAPLFAAQQRDFSLLALHSAAQDRRHYLQRPDLGRQLNASSRERALAACVAPALGERRLAIVIADGLSSLAIARHAVPFLQAFFTQLFAASSGYACSTWAIAPISIALQGRVAIGDEIAECLAAEMVVVLIGERPGLSSPDSMGLYLTYQAKPGVTDALRNCISNVRPQGLSYHDAASKLLYLSHEAAQRKLSGVALKDESVSELPMMQAQENFLLEK